MKPLLMVGIDTETTGLDPEKDKIIEIALDVVAYGEKSHRRVKTFNWRCHPGAGVTIDPGAQAVHGISMDDLEGAPSFADIAPKIIKVFSTCQLLVAHNVAFDIPFLATELVNAGHDIPDIKAVCTMEEGRLATPMGKLPNLGELCFAFDVDYNPDEAHAADYDIIKTMDCYIAGLRSGFYKLPDLSGDELEGAA